MDDENEEMGIDIDIAGEPDVTAPKQEQKRDVKLEKSPTGKKEIKINHEDLTDFMADVSKLKLELNDITESLKEISSAVSLPEKLKALSDLNIDSSAIQSKIEESIKKIDLQKIVEKEVKEVLEPLKASYDKNLEMQKNLLFETEKNNSTKTVKKPSRTMWVLVIIMVVIGGITQIPFVKDYINKSYFEAPKIQKVKIVIPKGTLTQNITKTSKQPIRIQKDTTIVVEKYTSDSYKYNYTNKDGSTGYYLIPVDKVKVISEVSNE